eukprot:7126525-Prymnesium_polylepis.1
MATVLHDVHCASESPASPNARAFSRSEMTAADRVTPWASNVSNAFAATPTAFVPPGPACRFSSQLTCRFASRSSEMPADLAGDVEPFVTPRLLVTHVHVRRKLRQRLPSAREVRHERLLKTCSAGRARPPCGAAQNAVCAATAAEPRDVGAITQTERRRGGE